MSDDKTLTKIPHFDGHYDHWSELMENLLRAKGLWSLVEEGYTEAAEGAALTPAQRKQLEELKTKDHQVKHYLFQAIDRVVFEQILDRKTSKIIWDSLKRKFGGNERVKRSLLQTLRREFEVLAMKANENIDDYFGRVMTVSNKMRSNGEDMSDSKIVEKILRTLTDKFTYVVVAIEESKDTNKMTVDELQSSLSVHEKKFEKTSYEEEDQVLNVRGRGRGSYIGRGRSFNKAMIECYRCHKLGHFSYECPTTNNEAHYAQIDEKDEVLLLAHVELQGTKRGDAWFVDSGCSNHMCGDRGMFLNLDTTFIHSVKLGNNHKLMVSGKGAVEIMLKGISYVVSDVYYVPELKNNILSVGQFQEKGLDVLFKGGERKTCSIFHPTKGKIAESVMSANRMFVLLGETWGKKKEERCLQLDIPNKTESGKIFQADDAAVKMQTKAKKVMGAIQDLANVAATQASKEEVDSRSVYVGNVDYACTPEEVQQHFQACGTVNRVTILTDKFVQPKGFAYMEFLEVEAVQEALKLNESELHGRQLKVSPKRTNVPGMKQFRPRRFNPYMARRRYLPYYSLYEVGSSAPSLRLGPARSVRPKISSPSELAVTGETDNEMDLG